MKNLLVTIPAKYEMAWAAEMQDIEAKMTKCLFPQPIGQPCAPGDNVLPLCQEHDNVREAFECCPDLDTLFPSSRPFTLESFLHVKFLGRIFSIGDGLAMETPSGMQYGYITGLHRVDAIDSLWLAKVTPFQEVDHFMGVCHAVAPDLDLESPFMPKYVWLNQHAVLPVNVVPASEIGHRVWLIPLH